MTANWKARWERQRIELADTRREVTRLRAALDEQNADLELILNDDAQVGHEAAKSHAIRRQIATIGSMRKQLAARNCKGKEMNYRYRVYNPKTGHQYADVDNVSTAVSLVYALQEYQNLDADEITVDVLVSEAV
ncbi:hypothetical protein QP735_04155 [Curtobacterium citreum]|uniref:hypothetical protein n=1 Tax=Curtobacterium citreum TaxID=2036 RepID=UPI00254D5EC9|nr:hypothetical protein [Curtobacterium citreum]MDK8171716.1 hypothetical protein [Curtobacterium citreum]